MSEQPKDELWQELIKVVRLKTTKLDGTEPLDHLADLCPTLLASAPEVLLVKDCTRADRCEAVRQLLRYVAFMSSDREVRAAGDLLGLSNDTPGELSDMSLESAQAIHAAYRRNRKDGPEKFARFGREIRQILAVRHYNYGIGWLVSKKKVSEEGLLGTFVDELCTYLDDEDGKLTKLAKDLGLLPTADVDPSSDPFLLSPSREVMDEEKAKQIVSEVLAETDEVAVYRLALSLNFDPSLTRATCDYMRTEEISIESACRILAADAGIFLDSLARHRKQASVTRRIRQVVKDLEIEHPRVIRALDFIVLLHHENIAAEYILAYLMECQYIDREKFEHAILTYMGAISPLIDAGLLKKDGAFVRMNPLVHSIVRELRRDKWSEVKERLDSIGFTDLSAVPSAQQLMEAKWSPTSIAARWVLDYVLVTRLHDQLQNRGQSSRSGKLAGADWMLIVEALRVRFLEKAAMAWVLFVSNLQIGRILSRLKEGLDDWEDIEAEELDFNDRFRFFEMSELIESATDRVLAIFRTLPEIQDGDDVLAKINPYFESCMTELRATLEEAFNRDEVSTQVGTLRFSDFFPMWEPR